MIVVQISRGLAPVQAIAEAATMASQLRLRYVPVLGLPLVAAKNAAVAVADEARDHLLFLEDDVLLSPTVWQAILRLTDDQVGYVRCRGRNGRENVYRRPDGTFSHAGTGCVVIPWPVLARLPRPVFEDRIYRTSHDLGDLVPGALRGTGKGSDTDFWYKVRHLEPAPTIVELGTVVHLKHPLNEVRNTNNPCMITAW